MLLVIQIYTFPIASEVSTIAFDDSCLSKLFYLLFYSS